MAGQAGDSTSAFVQSLSQNKKWASETASANPDFFPTSAKGQSPQILWIGCSDSRVPETTVLGMKPGDVFVHRNIANVVSPTDISLLSVVEFSVRHLKVKHVVVCGHSSCGGVNATLGNGHLGILDVWLQPMRALREKHHEELSKMEKTQQMDRLARWNVQASVDVVKRIPTVIEAVKERGLEIHGLLYDLAKGELEEVDVTEDEKTCACREGTFHLV